MPFSGKGKTLVGTRNRDFAKTAFMLAVLAATIASAKAPQRPAAKTSVAPRANELTLAGLRPGRDTAVRAKAKYGTKDMTAADGVLDWKCGNWKMTVDLDEKDTVRTVSLAEEKAPKAAPGNVVTNTTTKIPIPCYLRGPTALELERGKGFSFRNAWITGKRLGLGDSSKRLLQIYGDPDSRSPSTKDGQPLELWYYAFDWAGADVPQVMEVLCTKEANGNPGRVVEITLAAPSL
jgi:hypothetical protein